MTAPHTCSSTKHYQYTLICRNQPQFFRLVYYCKRAVSLLPLPMLGGRVGPPSEVNRTDTAGFPDRVPGRSHVSEEEDLLFDAATGECNESTL